MLILQHLPRRHKQNCVNFCKLVFEIQFHTKRDFRVCPQFAIRCLSKFVNRIFSLDLVSSLRALCAKSYFRHKEHKVFHKAHREENEDRN